MPSFPLAKVTSVCGSQAIVPMRLDPDSFDVQIYRSKPAVGDADAALDRLESIACESSNYGNLIVPWNGNDVGHLQVFAPKKETSAKDDGEDTYVFGMDGLVNPFARRWDVGVENVFGSALAALRIPEIQSYAQYISSSGKVIPQPVDLVFIAQPAVKSNTAYCASKVNRLGEHSLSTTFWTNHLEERQVAGAPKALLHLGIRVLSCFLPEEKRKEHSAAATRLDEVGHGIGGNFQYTTFWGETAEAFVGLADSPIVQAGRAVGFQAVFALKGGLLQETKEKHGVRNFKFTSVDNFSKSQIAFIGFWKQHSRDVDHFTLLGVTNQNCPLGILSSGGQSI